MIHTSGPFWHQHGISFLAAKFHQVHIKAKLDAEM